MRKRVIGYRTSAYRGVTKHVNTGKFEAHIWVSGVQVMKCK